MESKKKSTLEASHLLLGLGRIFAVVPFNKSASFFVRKIYPGIVLFAGTCFMIASAYGRMHHYKTIEITSFVLSLASDLSLVVCNCIAIAVSNYTNNVNLETMHEAILQLELEQFTPAARHKSPLREMLGIHAAWVFFLVCNMVLIVPDAPWYTQYFLLRELQNYHIIVTTMVMKNYLMIVKGQMQYLNEKLLMLRAENFLFADMYQQRSKIGLETITRQYTKLTYIIEQYNNVYGIYYINVYMYIVINFLVPMNLSMAYGGQGHRLGGYLIFLSVIWCTLPAIIFRDLFYPCENVVQEVRKLPGNCYQVMLHMNDKYKGELRELAIHITTTLPSFSADGWFDIDYKMVIPTITMIISYLIVLIQFQG